MPEKNTQNGAKPQDTPDGITRISVGGYKSIAQEQSIEIRPLTLLAGANSSGKSSIMQPLLLLKQTLEASYTRRSQRSGISTNPRLRVAGWFP